MTQDCSTTLPAAFSPWMPTAETVLRFAVQRLCAAELFLLCRGSIVLLPDGASVMYAAEAIEPRLLTD
jgi:hypothetical protein